MNVPRVNGWSVCIKRMMRFIPTHHLFCYLILDEPANIAEVLTVRQFCVLREHTVSYLEAACVLQLMCCLERIEVALFLHYFKRRYGVNVLLAVLSCISSNQFQTDSIVQTLLVDNVGNGVFLTAFERAFHQSSVFSQDTTSMLSTWPQLLPSMLRVPWLWHSCWQPMLEAFCFLGVELAIVIVQLTLSCA